MSSLRGIFLALAVLVALFATPSACRSPADMFQLTFSDNDACSTCKFAVRMLSDMLCDPSVDDTVVQWLDQLVCSQMADKAQCRDMVRGLAPAAVEWLRMNANPESMCGSISVCGNSVHSSTSHPFKQSQTAGSKQLRANKPNDMTCPLCMFVAGKVKEQMNDPAVQQSIHDASMAACSQLPQGVMQDACTSFVDDYEMMYFKYLADMEPSEVCMMIGTCLGDVLNKMQSERNAPLLQLSAADLAPISQLKQAMQAAAAASPHSNDHCETCKVVVQEMRQLVANPELQAQLMAYAKQACAVFPTVQPTCEADVDQYAPMVFGMMLAYLQPDQVCIELKMCPPPSLWSVVAAHTNLLGGKFASFSIISTTTPIITTTTTTTPTKITMLSATSSSSSSSASASSVGVSSQQKKAKVHGPGLALPMAS